MNFDESWKRAFRYALRIVGFSFIWVVVGLVFIFGGLTMMPSALRLGPSAMIGGIVLFGLGYLIVYVGFLVAILKYLPEINAEVLAEQLKSREATQEQTKTKA